MEALSENFNGSLTLAIQIFKGTYHKTYMNQLVSSQLDIDRADYLKRDSFFTGVAEGNINSERIITMLNVHNGELVVEEKGIYSVEKFLVARRLMYWQVYLHKTSLAAEQLLIRVLKRVKELVNAGKDIKASSALHFFITNRINKEDFNTEILDTFSRLDDYDIVAAMKEWQFYDDFVLSNLCKMILNRNILKIKLKSEPIAEEKLLKHKNRLIADYKISPEEADYFVFGGMIENQAYSLDDKGISILLKKEKVIDVVQASDQLNLQALSKPVKKYYSCYPKGEF